MQKILIKNVMLEGQITDILIHGSKIAKIANKIDVGTDLVIDAHDKAILPSFCNTHTHASMMFLRGIGEDKSLFDWLHHDIFPREAKLKPEHFYALSRYAIMEMIRTGTTCFVDMYFEIPQTIRAVHDMGIRAILPYPGMDFFDDQETTARIERAKVFFQTPSPHHRIQKALYCHAIYSCSERLIRSFYNLSVQYQTYFQMHVAETAKEVQDCLDKYGLRPVELLHKWGVLGPNTLLAHAVHLNDEEIDLIEKTKTVLSHCPTSNLKLNSGCMPLQKYWNHHLHMTLGTDGVASNNSLSMMSEMKIAALVAKQTASSEKAGKIADIFNMATQSGFKAFGIDAGVIAEGKLADFMLVDLNNQFLLPCHHLLSNMVYGADSSCITDVFCDGIPVMLNKKIAQEQEITADFKRVYKMLI